MYIYDQTLTFKRKVLTLGPQSTTKVLYAKGLDVYEMPSLINFGNYFPKKCSAGGKQAGAKIRAILCGT